MGLPYDREPDLCELDDRFYDFLESWLCYAVKQLPDRSLNYFWCDGVYSTQAATYYSQKYINDHREVQLRAFFGQNGQDLYDLYLTFGRKALSRHARGLDLKTCMPATYSGISIDPENRTILIQLY